ncbi:MAG: aminotransferase class I/II-fold pyridoxal phosphate-dependent enzyme [Bacteroidales bacterium]
MIILSSIKGSYVTSNGRTYSYFGGNNYLGLAYHPEIKKAAIAAIRKYGVNFSASRLTTGTSDLHIELEKRLSEFKNREDTILFPSGYQGNSIILSALSKPESVVLADINSHPSILESIPKGVRSVRLYDHCNPVSLEKLLKELPPESDPLIITDGVFALTGKIAPLAEIFRLSVKFNAKLIVDDAHSTGILGKNGLGTPEHFYLENEKDIYQTETLSKALGSYGGFISGSKKFINSLRERTSQYKASTALPPPAVAAGIAALNLIAANPGLRQELISKTTRLRAEIINLGFDTSTDDTPIIPLFCNSLSTAKNLSLFLEQNGIIIPAVIYPNKLEQHVVRITVSISHTKRQTDFLLKILKKWRNESPTNG